MNTAITTPSQVTVASRGAQLRQRLRFRAAALPTLAALVIFAVMLVMWRSQRGRSLND